MHVIGFMQRVVLHIQDFGDAAYRAGDAVIPH